MNWKHKFIGIAAILAVSLFSCEKLEDLLTFTISDSTTFTIEGVSDAQVPITVPTPDITTNSSQEFGNNNTKADLVKSIKLSNLTLTIQSPEDFTFSFLKSLDIFITAKGLEETKIAFKDNIPEDNTSIELETTEEELDAYIKKDSYSLRFEAVTREAFFNDVTIKADMEYRVTADPL